MSDTFVIDDGRYSRMELIAWWDQDKLANAKVMIVGVGALGNEVVKNLVLMGVGTLYVIDFDEIEPSNLNKSVLFRESDCGQRKVDVAARAGQEMNPDTTIVPIHGSIITQVGLGLFRDCDVVIGCLDNREARLWVNRMCWRVTTPWIDGGIQEINGVVKVFTPPDGACYECAMTENDYRLINLRYSCPLLKRDDILAGRVPTSPTISSIIAGVQCQEALKLIHDMPVKDGGAFVFNGIANSTYQSNFQHREDCLSHETFPPPIETNLTTQNSVKELFERAIELANAESSDEDIEMDKVRLILDRDLIVSIDCTECDESTEMMRCMQDVGKSNATCEKCGSMTRPKIASQIEFNDELANETLSRVGIPNYDIVQVQLGERREYFQLADESIV